MKNDSETLDGRNHTRSEVLQFYAQDGEGGQMFTSCLHVLTLTGTPLRLFPADAITEDRRIHRCGGKTMKQRSTQCTGAEHWR
ncbi:hypothetical protein JOB18_013289 [Solea senegalensis]|uniref:Uncharacterized protein n=1 Tax=Solea senegalensis TaxID=28829 RepID=A0AAV6T520_SOLSE|nr:hypothetical protein JOB18_013289 [Solea senegalensis]